MPNDVITLNAVASELDETLRGGRIEKIYQPETDEITLNVKNARILRTLVISANPSQPRIHISTQKKENSYTAPAFCMLLRKYLTGSFIEKIEIYNFDRIVKISVVSKNELKDVKRYFLFAELMGRYSNIILTDSEKTILDAIRRIHFDQSTSRYILPGLKYVNQEKCCLSLGEKEKVRQVLHAGMSGAEIIAAISGAGKETANEIACSPDPFDKLYRLLNIYKTDTYKPCLRYQNGTLKDYYIYPYSTVSGEFVEYNGINEALDAFYRLYDGNERKKASTKTVNTVLKRLQSKTERRIGDNLAKKKDAENAAFYKNCGDLILSYMYMIKPRDVSLSCYDYFDDKNIVIPLNPQFSPADNAQIYYKKYAKMKRAALIADEQLQSLYEQKEYLNSIAVSIDNCSLKSEYDEILAELNSLSGLRNVKKNLFVKEKPSRPVHFTVEGFDVYLGKNNIQNNDVTFNIASGNDVWLHVKAHHGSHVIIKGKPDKAVIEKCAAVAAKYSSASSSDKVEVDYTLRKYVKKIPSAMLGMVTYTNYRSVLVAPKDYTEIQDK